MAKKANKTKSKRRSTTKSNARRSGSKPLLADAASVRTATLSTSMNATLNGTPSTSMNATPNGTPATSMNTTPNGTPSAVGPPLPLIAMMGRIMGAYAELPARLSRCRNPMDIWLEQVRFVQRVFGAATAPASSRV